MRASPRRITKGLTLIELTIAMMMGMAIGGMTLLLFNQQLTFLKMYKTQNFLTEEAPIISMHVSRLIGKADRFRLHETREDAIDDEPQSTVDAFGMPRSFRTVLLNFRQPDGTVRATILTFENRENSGLALNYYVVPVNGTDPPVLQWSVTKSPRDVGFRMEEGILRMTLTGPDNEMITYSGTMQQ
jgi:hypothetical protein